MGVRLSVVLDQLVQIVDQDLASAALDLTRGLIDAAPSGCDVEAIAPARSEADIRGLAGVRALGLARRELALSWQMGVAAGVGGGLIHSSSLMAPLVKHDKVHDHDQTTVTLWDLAAWEAPATLPKSVAMSQRAWLKRATKHADAIVVPSHAFAERLPSFAKVGERIRVIPGAAPGGFRIPTDAADRRTALSLPDRYVVVEGVEASMAAGFRAAAAVDADAVVLAVAEGSEPRLAELAAASGLPESRLRVRSAGDAADRAAVIAGAAVLVATSDLTAWPWRVLEAMTLGVPVVAAESGAHRDVIADGGAVVALNEIPEAVVDAVGTGARRLSVLGADRSRSFSWQSSAERVWGLHADL